MAGISSEGANKGARRGVDREINMIPFVDLLMVTIAFLLVTAVWTSLSRVESHAKAPSSEGRDPTIAEVRALEVDVSRDGKSIALVGRKGTKSDAVATVALDDPASLERELQKAAATATGEAAIVRVPAAMTTGDVIRILDAVSTPKIPCKEGSCPAFRPTLSAT
jgi:biopolymer transport protein ExbD